jgi:hypothetical protein
VGSARPKLGAPAGETLKTYVNAWEESLTGDLKAPTIRFYSENLKRQLGQGNASITAARLRALLPTTSLREVDRLDALQPLLPCASVDKSPLRRTDLAKSRAEAGEPRPPSRLRRFGGTAARHST